MLVKFKAILEKIKAGEDTRGSKGPGLTGGPGGRDWVELMECIPAVFVEVTNEVSKKASSEGIIKALALKANATDVSEGFAKMKAFIETKSVPSETEGSGRKLGRLEPMTPIAPTKTGDFVTGRQLKTALADYASQDDLDDLSAALKAQGNQDADLLRSEINTILEKMGQTATNFELRFSELADSLRGSVEDAVARESTLAANLEAGFETKTQGLAKLIESKLTKEFGALRGGKIEELARKPAEAVLRELTDLKKMTDLQFSELSGKLDNHVTSTRSQYNAFKSETIAAISGCATRANEEVVFQEIYGHIKRFQGDLAGIRETLRTFEKEHERRMDEVTEAVEASKRSRKEVAGFGKRLDGLEAANALTEEFKQIKDEIKVKIDQLTSRLGETEQAIPRMQKELAAVPSTPDLLSHAVGEASRRWEVQAAPRLVEVQEKLRQIEVRMSAKSSSRGLGSPGRSTSPPMNSNRRLEGSSAASLKKLRAEVARKADLTKICSLLDQKADIAEVNQLIKPIYSELDALPSPDDLLLLQDSLQHTLPLLLTQGLWLWKNGGVRERVVQWDIERQNFRPQHFTLIRSNCAVEVSEAGLYQLSFGFFGRTQAVIDLYLNGEVVLTSEKSHMNASTQKYEATHSNGYVVGQLTRHHLPRLRRPAALRQTLVLLPGSRRARGLRGVLPPK